MLRVTMKLELLNARTSLISPGGPSWTAQILRFASLFLFNQPMSRTSPSGTASCDRHAAVTIPSNQPNLFIKLTNQPESGLIAAWATLAASSPLRGGGSPRG